MAVVKTNALTTREGILVNVYMDNVFTQMEELALIW